MSLFKKSDLTTDEIFKLEDISVLTATGYIARQMYGLKPGQKLPNLEPTLIDLTMGQTLRLLFGEPVNVSLADASNELKDEFNSRVKPHLERIANEVVYQDEDLGRLSLNCLEQKAALLEKAFGISWNTTEPGLIIDSVLNTVFQHSFTKAISPFKYRYIVFSTRAKYEKAESRIDWKIIFDINNYG